MSLFSQYKCNICPNICYVIYVILWIKYCLMWFESLLVFILLKKKNVPTFPEFRLYYEDYMLYTYSIYFMTTYFYQRF